jgi:hypothetical protein
VVGPGQLEWLAAEAGDWLCYPAYPGGYRIVLDQCTHSAAVLNLIIQVTTKTWATDECLAGLVRALHHILDPQQHLCSGERDKELPVSRIRELLRVCNRARIHD